jgi:signal transduction histidine kinase
MAASVVYCTPPSGDSRWQPVVVFAVLSALASSAHAPSIATSIVLVLCSEGGLSPASAAFTEGLRDGLKSSSEQVEEQHLDISRFSGEAHDLALAEWLTSRYRERRVSVVIPLGVPASAFASRFAPEIWPEVRIVHAAIDGDRLRAVMERGEPVIPRVTEYRRTLEVALALFPETRQISVIAGATEQDRRWLDQAEGDLARFGERVHIDRIAGLRWPEVLDRVSHLPEHAVAIFLRFSADADGRIFLTPDVLPEIAKIANRPLFVMYASMLGSGAIGGYFTDPAEMGRQTANIVRRVLDDPAAPPPQIDLPSTLTFDAVQLRRWNISESKLPAGSLVLNRELPAWRRSLWTLLATVVLVAVQGAVIGALLVQRRSRRRIEAALRNTEEKVRASYDEVRDLAGRLISAREGERTRIARDLHDDIGQRVASLSIALSRIQRQIPDASNSARQSLSDLEQQSTQLSADLRHLSHELHPGALEHLGLLEALRERCDDFRQESGLSVQLDVAEAWRDVSDAVALCLYRVTQEALRNVATHAKAQNVTISLDQLNGHVVMHVTDDGCGFDPAAKSRRLGLGLVSLNERVHMLGGTLDITTARGAGTRIAVRLPAGGSHAP